jgi:hypothetical protein
MGVCRLLIIALVFAACGGEASAATLQGSVKYGKSGGIAGLIQNMTIRPDGSGVASSYESKRTFKLSASRLRQLEKAVRAADLAHTRNPKKRSEGADGFNYGVSYRGHRVSWSDFTDDPPKRVQRLYALLDELYETYGPPR